METPWYDTKRLKRQARRLELFQYKSLRNDWYRANQALPRAIRQTVNGTREFIFRGFPRQWAPLFFWFGVPFEACIEPSGFLPFFSNLTEEKMDQMLRRAVAEHMLRPLVEAVCALDPVVSDCLYILDHTVKRLSPAMLREFAGTNICGRKMLLLTTWQSYGRPSVLHLEEKINKVELRGEGAVIMPCSFRRPYSKSPTHRRIESYLVNSGYDPKRLHKIVITSLGLIPEELWEEPEVVSYDAGVPDIYRLLRLTRTFFASRTYNYVLDCSQFPPYSDVLRIAWREGFIKEIHRIKVPRIRSFHLRQPRPPRINGVGA